MSKDYFREQALSFYGLRDDFPLTEEYEAAVKKLTSLLRAVAVKQILCCDRAARKAAKDYDAFIIAEFQSNGAVRSIAKNVSTKISEAVLNAEIESDDKSSRQS